MNRKDNPHGLLHCRDATPEVGLCANLKRGYGLPIDWVSDELFGMHHHPDAAIGREGARKSWHAWQFLAERSSSPASSCLIPCMAKS